MSERLPLRLTTDADPGVRSPLRAPGSALLDSFGRVHNNFRVSVTDTHGGLVAAGRITRVSVERARFLEKAAGA